MISAYMYMYCTHQSKCTCIKGHCIPCQKADGHHHLDYVNVNLSLYWRSVIIFSRLMIYKIIDAK